MGALVMTEAEVQPPSDGGRFLDAKLGEDASAGASVYIKASDGLIYKTVSNGSLEAASSRGILDSDGLTGQYARITRGPEITLGATAAPAKVVYYVGRVAGTIVLFADLLSGDYIHPIGIGDGTSVLKMNIHNSGIAVT